MVKSMGKTLNFIYSLLRTVLLEVNFIQIN